MTAEWVHINKYCLFMKLHNRLIRMLRRLPNAPARDNLESRWVLWWRRAHCGY